MRLSRLSAAVPKMDENYVVQEWIISLCPSAVKLLTPSFVRIVIPVQDILHSPSYLALHAYTCIRIDGKARQPHLQLSLLEKH